jgi:hypothetical protein
MIGGSFLTSAKSRLLPASVPFRFFATASVFHVALWAALVAAADEFVQFRGGVGPSLGAVHLLTVGVLVMTAIGAALQLLPVATARPIAAIWPAKAGYWLVGPGAVALAAGMYAGNIAVMIGGASACAAAVLLFAWLLAENLIRAGSMPIVRVYGWTALGSLLLLVAFGVVLSLDDRIGFLHDHGGVALAHMVFGVFGFMGMLAFGFSHVLVPMFALSHAPKPRQAWAGFALAGAALVAAAGAALVDWPPALVVACVLGLAAALLHVRLMAAVLAAGMRKRLGLSFVLVRISWAFLVLTPLVGLAAAQGWAGPRGPTLFGLVALGGWLMTFLFAILQRIMPFLASMHTSRSGGAPLLLSAIGSGRPLTVHACCHVLAIAGLAAAIVSNSGRVAMVAAGVGLAGAVAFAAFVAGVLRTVHSNRPES